jgi:uncharacterized DUF497 family protein
MLQMVSDGTGGRLVLDFDFIEWDDTNERKVGDHGLTTDDVENVLRTANPVKGVSRTSGRPLAEGWTTGGRYVRVVYETMDAGGVVVLRPVTAYDIDPP